MDLVSINVLSLAFLLFSKHASAVLVMSPCVNYGGVTERFAEVRQSSTSHFSCSGFGSGDTVNWVYVPDNGNQDITIGSCPTSGCSEGVLGPGEGFTLTRPQATNTSLALDATVAPKSTVQSGSLKCGTATETSLCKMDLIIAATQQGTSCSVTFDTTTWSTSGRCDVSSSTSSSQGRYYCRWYRTKTGLNEEERKKTDYTISNKICNFDDEIPPSDGTYSFKIKITPGETFITANFNGTSEIKTPSTTTVSDCGGGTYITENTAVTCACGTNNVGLPQGRLQWVSGTGGGVVEATGQPGVTTITMSKVLLRTDHQTKVFRCNVLWKTNVNNGNQQITFNVGYKPEKLNMTFTTQNTVPEHSDVTVTCQADGRPTVNLRLTRDSGPELKRENSSLTHTLQAVTCSDAGVYRCEANNTIGSVDVTKQLYVLCKPRSVDTHLSLEFYNQPEMKTFEVTAYPVPTNFTFFRPTMDGSTTTTTPPTTGLQTNVTCQQKISDVDYVFTCTLTVLNVTSQAAGQYTLRVGNGQGYQDYSLNISHSTSVTTAGNPGSTNNVPAIAGGVVGGVAGIIVIVVIAVVTVRRRKSAGDRGKERLTRQTSAGQSSPTSSSEDVSTRPLSFSPAAEYSAVNKQKNSHIKNGKTLDNESTDKSKTKSPKKLQKTKKPANENETAHIYNNMEFKMQTKTGKANAAATPATTAKTPATDKGQVVNPDGLIYTQVEFSGVPHTANPTRTPDTEQVIYSTVDIEKTQASKEK